MKNLYEPLSGICFGLGIVMFLLDFTGWWLPLIAGAGFQELSTWDDYSE